MGFTTSLFGCNAEKTAQHSNSTHIYVAKGLHHGKIVGIQIEVKSNMPAGITKDGEISNIGFIKTPVTTP